MVETLVHRIEVIEAIPEYVSTVDKNIDIKKAFEEYAERNRIVRAVLNGETTFREEYDKAFGQYDFRKLSFPYSLPPGFKEKVADLEAAIGYSELDDSNFNLHIPRNPVAGLSWAAVALALSYPLGILENRVGKKQLNRRDFLKLGSVVTGAFGFLGVGAGTIGAFFSVSNLGRIEQNAVYLDNTYKKLYRK